MVRLADVEATLRLPEHGAQPRSWWDPAAALLSGHGAAARARTPAHPRRRARAVLVLGGWVVLAVARDHASVPSFATMWVAMSVAMMIPTVLRPMMRAAQGSVAGAWRFAAGSSRCGWSRGCPTYVVMNAVEWTSGWIATAWVLAGAYQLTPVMQRNLTTCRSVRYAGDPARYGVRQGVRCVASCWPVMLAVMVTAMALPGTVLPLLALVARHGAPVLGEAARHDRAGRGVSGHGHAAGRGRRRGPARRWRQAAHHSTGTSTS